MNRQDQELRAALAPLAGDPVEDAARVLAALPNPGIPPVAWWLLGAGLAAGLLAGFWMGGESPTSPDPARQVVQPQDPDRATVAPKIEAADALLHWDEPATALVRRVRAMAPAPGARTQLEGTRILVLAARAEAGAVDRPPGTVRARPGEPLRIATGEGWLIPLRLQRAGGKVLEADAYLRGRPIADGTRLGDPAGGLPPTGNPRNPR